MAKVPPPPNIPGQDPTFNRWLLELTSILNASGDVDVNNIPGYAALQNEVAQNTLDIQTNTLNINSLANGQGTQGTAVAALQNRMTAAEGNITTLQARNQVFNGTGGAPSVGLGIDGDWYYNRGGVAGSRLYIKVAGAWSAQAI